MKVRTICTGLALLFAFGIAVQALADGGPNPGVPAGQKTIGPKVKGTLIVGWKWNGDTSPSPRQGQVDAFLYLNGRLYASVLYGNNPENVFLLESDAEDVTGYPFPDQIAVDYKMPANTVVKVLTENDVQNFTIIQDIPNYGIPSPDLSYQHMIHCQVQISFLIPK